MTQSAFKLLRVADSLQWNLAVPATAPVFASNSYTRIAAEHHGDDALLLVVENCTGKIAYPMLLRPVSSLPFADGMHAYDSVTPEFTGPIMSGTVGPDLRSAFRDALRAECRNLHIVSEFAHLYPWADIDGIVDEHGTEYDRDIVWIDVSLSHEVLWREHFSHACRKNINRAKLERVRVFEAETKDHVRDFHQIYVQTMDRHNANKSYYFDLSYFLSIFVEMRPHARFALAEHRGRIVSAILYLHDDLNVYSYLGGADAEAQQARPSNAIIFDTINWARAQGKRRLILGGGYLKDDGIFRFKCSFSKHVVRFYTYRHIHMPNEYSRLERLWSQYYGTCPSSGYFPVYRSRPPLILGSAALSA